MNKRIDKLAKMIVNYSLEVKKNDRVLIFGNNICKKYIEQFIKEIKANKAEFIPIIFDKNFEYNLIKKGSKKEMRAFFKESMKLAKRANCVIDIENEYPDFEDLPADNLDIYGLIMKPFWDYLVYDRTGIRRATVLLPTEIQAKQSSTSLKQFEDYFYATSLLNWKSLTKKYESLMKIIKKSKKVELIGEGVNLKFEIIGKYAVLENGKENIPGGEIYMAPVKESLNGWIKFDYPIFTEGKKIEGIYLKFENGKIIDFDSKTNKDKLKSIINKDPGSKYIGEFGIGINPKADKKTCLWFDEKNIGTIHLAIGKCYWENKGKNDSAIHLDIIKEMKNAKMIFDGKIIQENGKWKI